MPRSPAQVAELYGGMSFGIWVDQVIARRTAAIRARHVEELRADAHAEVQAAEQAARTAAGGG
jgi:hypothetical protein